MAGIDIAKESENIIDVLRRIVEGHSYETIEFPKGGKLMVDVQTANAVITVYDALKEGRSKAKFEEMVNSGNRADFIKTVNIVWKLIK